MITQKKKKKKKKSLYELGLVAPTQKKAPVSESAMNMSNVLEDDKFTKAPGGIILHYLPLYNAVCVFYFSFECIREQFTVIEEDKGKNPKVETKSYFDIFFSFIIINNKIIILKKKKKSFCWRFSAHKKWRWRFSAH